jgi:hypothetical protein
MALPGNNHANDDAGGSRGNGINPPSHRVPCLVTVKGNKSRGKAGQESKPIDIVEEYQ